MLAVIEYGSRKKLVQHRLGEEPVVESSTTSNKPVSKLQVALIAFVAGIVLGALYGQRVGQ